MALLLYCNFAIAQTSHIGWNIYQQQSTDTSLHFINANGNLQNKDINGQSGHAIGDNLLGFGLKGSMKYHYGDNPINFVTSIAGDLSTFNSADSLVWQGGVTINSIGLNSLFRATPYNLTGTYGDNRISLDANDFIVRFDKDEFVVDDATGDNLSYSLADTMLLGSINSDGTAKWLNWNALKSSFSSANFYTDNGMLAGDRFVDGDGFRLEFSNLGSTIFNTQGFDIQAGNGTFNAEALDGFNLLSASGKGLIHSFDTLNIKSDRTILLDGTNNFDASAAVINLTSTSSNVNIDAQNDIVLDATNGIIKAEKPIYAKQNMIFISDNGTCFEVSVDNSGAWITQIITCP